MCLDIPELEKIMLSGFFRTTLLFLVEMRLIRVKISGSDLRDFSNFLCK